MDRQLSLAEAALSSTLPGLGLNDQACNECKRRKGRCDRQLPECGPCARNKRHCLYERHSKTPLTRKYLTSVEERLRQAELRWRQMERRAQVAEAKLAEKGENVVTARQSPEPHTGIAASDPDPVDESLREGVTGEPLSPASAKRWEREFAASAQVIDTAGPRAFAEASHNDWQYLTSDAGAGNPNDPSPTFREPFDNDSALLSHELEAPPTEADDFSWDESAERLESRHEEADLFSHSEPSVVDGMASLSVEDSGSGYLGVASGAAMLRLLLPDAEHRRPLKRPPRTHHHFTSEEQPVDPQDQGWVPTPVWAARDIASIDLDAAINSYFSLYHVSYPVVHEASFRAQYAQVIARPGGRSWNALAYMIGAIGLFTTANGPVSKDADLFEAAKANISIDSLESGSLTSVQVLALMSNYLQKRNRPNSGYNYLGLALHMAMGLGLHKEFHNWRIAPLSMEIR
ncbi:hypothetical protein B0A55_10040 [Friedmanniomyces simplex]|uniref:Zn(2)-C6 fungal-type domain-containing protein n=1 Tax=Friedmanniomyces simplex TaxID=329884 RepID=A0A4U0WTV3_9PEZI|nr:hypothetical protein B0A55_10040 [Friedmanniomyces simplex]